MNEKINFKSEAILNKKFSTELSGYSAIEVDQFFDKVIEDYNTYEEIISGYTMNIEDKANIIQELKQKNDKLEIEMQNLKDQLDKSLEGSNAEILKEVRKLKSELSEFQKK